MDDEGCSSLADVRGLQPLRSLDDVEFDPLPFLEGTESLGVDGGVVDEHVLAALLRDEAEALRVIEPLHSTGRHRTTSPRKGRPTKKADRTLVRTAGDTCSGAI